MSEHYKMLHNEHYKSVGDPWPDVNVNQWEIPDLTIFMQMLKISQREIPGLTPYYVDVKHNTEMVSFVCQGEATSVCTKMLLCTDNAEQILGG